MALMLTFCPNANAVINAAYKHNYNYSSIASTTTLTSLNDSIKQTAAPALEVKTKVPKEETQKLHRIALNKRGRDAYFDCKAKQAVKADARIEAAKHNATLEFENNKEEMKVLAILELKKEQEAKLATTLQQRQELKREAWAPI